MKTLVVEESLSDEGDSAQPKNRRACAKAVVLVVDPHPLIRDGLRRLLNLQDDLVCCGEAATPVEAFAAIEKHRPDLVILEPSFKRGNGVELVKSFKASFPDLLILCLSQSGEQADIETALQAGAQGYLLKEQAPEKLLSAIRCALIHTDPR